MQNMRGPDPAKMKTAGRLISMMMGLILSFFQSLAGQLRSGQFTFQGWIVSLALSIAVSWLIGYIVPMGKVSHRNNVTDQPADRLHCSDGQGFPKYLQETEVS